jgi:hypothetical protein
VSRIVAKEIAIEIALRDGVEARGGHCLKLSPRWYVGIPDRLVLLPGGVIVFVELKRPRGGVLGRKQGWWRTALQRLGFRVEHLNTIEAVEHFLETAYL